MIELLHFFQVLKADSGVGRRHWVIARMENFAQNAVLENLVDVIETIYRLTDLSRTEYSQSDDKIFQYSVSVFLSKTSTNRCGIWTELIESKSASTMGHTIMMTVQLNSSC